MKDRFQPGSGTYICGDCGKQTRETGYGESESGLCACCFRVAEWENALSDGNIDEVEFERITEEIKKEYDGKKLKNFSKKMYNNKKEDIMNAEQLRKAASDLNNVLGLEPKIGTREPKEELEKKIKKAGKLLEDGDKIEQNTFDVLAELEVDIPAGVKKVKAQKTEGASEKKEGKAKESKKEPGKPGVIATIFEIVKEAKKDKPVTSEQILKKLEKAFPEKDSNGMMNTIKIQLPGRMSREKNINIQRDEKGGFFTK